MKLRTNSLLKLATQIAKKSGIEVRVDNEQNVVTFETDDGCIYVPDISIDSFLEIEKSVFNGASYIAIENIIYNRFKEALNDYDPDAVFVVFCLLHECGHYAFIGNEDLYSAAAINNYILKNDRLKEEFGVESTAYHEKYRELPQEREADEYALQHLLQVLECFTSE